MRIHIYLTKIPDKTYYGEIGEVNVRYKQNDSVRATYGEKTFSIFENCESAQLWWDSFPSALFRAAISSGLLCIISVAMLSAMDQPKHGKSEPVDEVCQIHTKMMAALIRDK